MTTPQNRFIIGEHNVMCVFCSRVHLAAVLGQTIGTFRNYDGDGKENVKKAIGLISKKNNNSRASRFFVHFFAVPAQLRREMTKF